MERIGDTVWTELVAAADRAGAAVVYCNVCGNAAPVLEGCCSGCGEQLPWVEPRGAGSP